MTNYSQHLLSNTFSNQRINQGLFSTKRPQSSRDGTASLSNARMGLKNHLSHRRQHNDMLEVKDIPSLMDQYFLNSPHFWGPNVMSKSTLEHDRLATNPTEMHTYQFYDTNFKS